MAGRGEANLRQDVAAGGSGDWWVACVLYVEMCFAVRCRVHANGVYTIRLVTMHPTKTRILYMIAAKLELWPAMVAEARWLVGFRPTRCHEITLQLRDLSNTAA